MQSLYISYGENIVYIINSYTFLNWVYVAYASLVVKPIKSQNCQPLWESSPHKVVEPLKKEDQIDLV